MSQRVTDLITLLVNTGLQEMLHKEAEMNKDLQDCLYKTVIAQLLHQLDVGVDDPAVVQQFFAQLWCHDANSSLERFIRLK